MVIHDFLLSVRRRLRQSILFEGLSRVMVVLCLTALGLGVLDYIFHLPAILRLLVLLAYVFVVVDTLYLRLWLPLHADMSDEQLIALLERKVPELNGRAFVAHDELPLSDAETAALKELLDGPMLHRVIPAPHMKQWLLSSGSVLLVIGLIVVLNSALFGTAMQRLLLPFSQSEWQRSTVIKGGLAGKDVIAEDQPFVFQFERVSGDPQPLEVRWQDQSGIEGHKIFDGMNSVWRQSLQLGPGSYTFSVTSGDSLPVMCSGTVVERPQLASIKARIIPPAYLNAAVTEISSEELSTLDISVLAGSEVEYELEFKAQTGRTLSSISVFAKDALIPSISEAHRASGTLLITEETVLRLSAADQDGIAIKPEPEYTIKIQTDHAPQIQLSGPARSEKVLLQAEVDMRLDARDDYGIEQMQLEMRREPKKGDSTEHDLAEFTFSKSRRDTSERYKLNVKEFAANEDRLVLYAKAQDGNTVTGPGIGQSNQIELLVVSEQDLRREIQRLIGEARERVQQSRDALLPGLSDVERMKQYTNHAGALAQKSTEQLHDILRRWQENKLPASEMQSVDGAHELLKQEIRDDLLQAKDVAGARTADLKLAKVYRMLSSAVNNSDLPHELAALIEQQKDLSEQSKAFVLKYSVAALDDAARNTQAALSERQRELSAQVREWEQKLSDSKDSRYEAAQEKAREERPASRLTQAAQQLSSDDKRQEAVGEQERAIDAMEQIYRVLQGSGSESMSDQIGAVAKRQDELAKQMQAGEQGEAQKKEQRELEELTKRILDQLERQEQKNKNEEDAAKHLAGAKDSQQSAQKSMQQGKQQEAQTDATVAANLLKQAQKALAKENESEDKEDEESFEVLSMLKKMRSEQTEVVSDALALFRQMGDVEDVNFRQKRQISSLDAVEKKLLGTLRDEAFPALEKQKLQLAMWGLKRLDVALVRTHEHLQKPALGERGVSLTKSVLHEIDRMIKIIEDLPKPKSNQEGESEGDGDGQGGEGDAFPKIAELNLLAQAQELLLHYTMSRYGERIAADQRELSEMINHVTAGAKEGSRARILLDRTKRAMNLATTNVQQEDFGAGTQNHQRLAVLTLQQIMREAKSQQNKNGKGKPKPQDQKDQDQQQQSSKPQQGQSAPKPGSGQAALDKQMSAEQAQALQNAPDAVKAIVEQHGVEWFLNLPPKVRQSLIEMNSEPLPAGARELFQRYLERLEDMEP